SGKLDGSGKVTRMPDGEFADCDPYDGVFWNDTNKDAIPQRSECIIVPAKKKANKVGGKGDSPLPLGGGWGSRMDQQLRFYTNGITAYAPMRFDDAGAPIYTPESMKPLGVKDRGDLVPVWDEPMLLVMSMTGYAGPTLGIRGVDTQANEVEWTYPNTYPHVHGSHRATMPSPGLVIGPLKITGVVEVNERVGHVLHLRGNLGQDFFLTADGIYIDSMFQDTRLPGQALPATEAALYDQPLPGCSMGGEPFNGWFGKQDDGVIRLTGALARQACTIMPVQGLDSIQRLPAQSINVDAPR